MAADLAGGGGGVAAVDPDGPDGVRMTWNAWPRSKVEASKCVIPVAVSIAPIRASPSLVVLPYAPLRCKPPCAAALNPFARVDFAAKIWICPICFSRNHFPPHYAAMSETNVPGELYPQCTTVEYAAPPLDASAAAAAAAAAPPPVFLFVLDTCLIEEELGFVKSAMRRALGLLPDHALVGLVTFGTQVHLHELGFSDLSKIYVFRGTKEISKEQILDQLGLSATGIRPGAAGAPGYPKAGLLANGLHPSGSVNRFLLPASDCEYTLNAVRVFLYVPVLWLPITACICTPQETRGGHSFYFWIRLKKKKKNLRRRLVLPLFQLLDELQTDQWPVEAGNRSLRCTGVALSVAAGLLGACMPGTGARIIALVGGPCTEGPGMVLVPTFLDAIYS